MTTSFRFKKIIVTGHTRGLGKALTLQALNDGFDVLGISRQTMSVDGIEPTRLDARNLTQIPLDLSDTDALLQWLGSGCLQDWLSTAEQALLINNAGQVTPILPAGQADALALAGALTLNVTAPIVLTNAFIAGTAHCADRRVLHISSGAGRSPYAGWTAYCAAKAALDHHARSVAAEQQTGLRVASIAPGVIDTDMQADIRQTEPRLFPMLQRFLDLKNSGGLSAPEDVATRLLRYALGPAFGSDTVADIRSLSH